MMDEIIMSKYLLLVQQLLDELDFRDLEDILEFEDFSERLYFLAQQYQQQNSCEREAWEDVLNEIIGEFKTFLGKRIVGDVDWVYLRLCNFLGI